MRLRLPPGEKPLYWVGSSKRDLLEFPEAVKDTIGSVPSVAQFGGKHPAAKPWKGEGPGVLEIVEDYRGDAYRAVYTVRFERAVYVLHAFQKKVPGWHPDGEAGRGTRGKASEGGAAGLRGKVWQNGRVNEKKRWSEAPATCLPTSDSRMQRSDKPRFG